MLQIKRILLVLLTFAVGWLLATTPTLLQVSAQAFDPITVDNVQRLRPLVSWNHSLDTHVLLGDAATGRELLTFSGHAGVVSSAAWSPDGTRIVTASLDSTPKVWRVFQTPQDLIAYARQCCLVRELTADERAKFGLPTLEPTAVPAD